MASEVAKDWIPTTEPRSEEGRSQGLSSTQNTLFLIPPLFQGAGKVDELLDRRLNPTEASTSKPTRQRVRGKGGK